jgi:hypothetical protein
MDCKYKIIIPSNKTNCKFILVKNKEHIGSIDFHIECNQITICWLCINLDIQRCGYGSKMIKMFEEYISKNHQSINTIVLIPEYFNGVDKNSLCIFYEKNGYIQESIGYPYYIKYVSECPKSNYK